MKDWRVMFNPISFDDQWIYDPYNKNPRPRIDIDTIALFAELENKLYSDTIILTFRNELFEAKSRGFISDDEKMKGVYYIDTGVESDFMNLYFLDFDQSSNKLNSSFENN